MPQVCSHNGAQRNVAQIVLPPETDSVTAIPLSFNLTNLALPPGMLEAWSNGTIYVPPQLAFAGVVNGEAGDGNLRPFRGDLLNSLYVRLQLGATVKSLNLPVGNTSANLSTLRLALPGGYTCVEIGDAPALQRGVWLISNIACALGGHPRRLGLFLAHRREQSCRYLADGRPFKRLAANHAVFRGPGPALNFCKV
eukprot:s418_g6.t1